MQNQHSHVLQALQPHSSLQQTGLEGVLDDLLHCSRILGTCTRIHEGSAEPAAILDSMLKADDISPIYVHAAALNANAFTQHDNVFASFETEMLEDTPFMSGIATGKSGRHGTGSRWIDGLCRRVLYDVSRCAGIGASFTKGQNSKSAMRE